MTKIETGLTVKDWFANKIANELGRNLTLCDIFAIINETEKAVYAMISVGADKMKTMWIPKSVLVETEQTGVGTWKIENYEEASRFFHSQWSMFI